MPSLMDKLTPRRVSAESMTPLAPNVDVAPQKGLMSRAFGYLTTPNDNGLNPLQIAGATMQDMSTGGGEALQRAQMIGQEQAEANRKRAALAQLRARIPEELQPLFDIYPEAVLKQLMPEKKPLQKVGAGESIYDPNTGKTVYSGQQEGPKPYQFSGGMQWVPGKGWQPVESYWDRRKSVSAAGGPQLAPDEEWE